MALVERAVEEFGKVDCLINNAFGIPPMDPITTIPIEALRAANETNVFAPLRLSALFADALAASQRLDHHAQLLRGVQLAAGVRRLQALEGRARAPRLVARHRARPARHPGQLGRAVVHLRGRQQGLLRLAGLRGRRHPRRHLRREGRRRPTSSGWRRRRRSPGPRCSSPPTWPPRSPARCSRSTAVSSTTMTRWSALERLTDAAARPAGRSRGVPHERQRHDPRARGRRSLRGHRRRGRAHHRAVRLRRHRARGGAAGPGRGPRLARGRADAARQLLPALGGEERAGRRAAHPGRVHHAPRARATYRSSGRSS